MCIKTEERSVHSISPAILSLDKKGDVGIKILGRDNIVEFAPVTMIESNSETTWVAGLPEQVDIITTGQGFAVVGQKVKPVFEGEQQGSAKE
ncbi:MAG: efflux RND transporter periplasmic adaptor subunit, partial [Gammaproteobacteria bacterium]